MPIFFRASVKVDSIFPNQKAASLLKIILDLHRMVHGHIYERVAASLLGRARITRHPQPEPINQNQPENLLAAVSGRKKGHAAY